MTTTNTPEYRKLELESSNDIIRHDARRSDRKYAAAALHARAAGTARLRMGQIMFDASDFTQAAADWLAAAACFHLATDPKRMRDALDRAQQLECAGKIPPERRDIHTALKEREEELQVLEAKLARFHAEYAAHAGSGSEALDWLQTQVRELPGSLDLHTAIVTHAGQLGQKALAARHLDWAEQIEPDHPPLRAFRAALRPLEV